jgi:hypothetical protein
MLRDTPSYGLYFVIYAVSCNALTALERRMLERPAPLSALAGTLDKGGGSGGGVSSGSTSSSSGGGGGSGGGGSSSGTSSEASLWVQLVSGGLAGMLAWAPVYPLDVVKSRIQARAPRLRAGPWPPRALRWALAIACARAL